MKKERLDSLVFSMGLTSSRESARASIMAGLVFVNGQRSDKPGTPVSQDSTIELRGETLKYVSRGGLKLEKALSVFDVRPEGFVCIDCGASTGGFTDCLLQNGAAKVYAVDVGYGQLAWSIRSDPRVITLERTNMRYVTREQIPEPVDLAVMDMSFISLRLVLPAVRELLKPTGQVICLIKPQFEAGREHIGKKGVVRDRGVHLDVLRSFLNYSTELGFSPMALDYSPVRGPEGNIEYLGYMNLDPKPNAPIDPETVVNASHNAFEEHNHAE